LTATGFITAVIVVLVLCFVFKVDIQVIIIALAIVLVLVVGLPLFIFAVRENNDRKDESETCKPIMQSFEKHRSTDRLIEDYRAWQKGEHSTYTRVHFGGDVVYALQGAKAYEEALEILADLENIQGMKPRERYDYETYRDQVKPELLEGIETEKKRAEERARNKNLKK
jgi:Co/Zn/Cd efflux system component